MKQEIRSLLPGHPWADSICFFESIDSTNTRAKEMAAALAPHGTVLIADRQTGGRGRLGRSFYSPAGVGLYLSVILRPKCGPKDLMHLTCAAAVAACDAVEEVSGLRPRIKWTNDLVYKGRKLAGILTELALDPKTGLVQYAVVGIGINCGQTPSDFPPEIRDMAVSLSALTGRGVDRSHLAAAVIDHLRRMDSGLLTQKKSTMERYCEDCITIGKEVSVHHFDKVRHGTAIGVDEDGALLVRFPDGHTEAVSSGEVSVRGMYGYV